MIDKVLRWVSRGYSRIGLKYCGKVEDRIGQVWVSRYYDDVDLSKATVFVITERQSDWTNPHTGKVLAYWGGRTLADEHSPPGRMYVWCEDNFTSGGDSYDNVYERLV